MDKGRKRSRMTKGQRYENAQSNQSRLVELLQNNTSKRTELARSFARHILAVSRKHSLSLPDKAKLLLCRKCASPFTHGENVRIRIRRGRKIVTCLKCQNIRRYGFKN